MPNTTDSITAPLVRKFQAQRIVFWYDDNAEMRKEFEAVAIVGVEKVEIDNNEFGLKYRMLRQQPQQKFLVYKAGSQPEDRENWLLDVQLSHDIFRTDRVSQTLDELGLPVEFRGLMESHSFFFNAVKRKSTLQRLLKNDDTENQVRIKMLAVCAGSDPRVDSVLENLLAELADDKSEKMNLVEKAELAPFLWEQLRRAFGYASDQPSLKDFTLTLFKSCYAREIGGDVALSNESVVFLRRWMDSYTHRDAFEKHSEDAASILRIAEDLQHQELKVLIDLDYFQLIDQRILSELSRSVINQTISAGECKQIIRQRRDTHWYENYEAIYESIEHGTQFLDLMNRLEIRIDSTERGLEAYVRTYYQVDQAYRKFVYHYRQASQTTLLSELFEQICRKYTNQFLLPLGDRWQAMVNESDAWKIPGTIPQRDFYRHFVKGKNLDKNRKAIVIISDALRFEAGHELCDRINQEDRFEAELGHMLTGLPSYTQLGMASLLPHKQIEINDDRGATVNVDGHSTSGTANRDKILKGHHPDRGLAITAKDLMALMTKECAALVRDNDVIYIYHNRIDDIGHSQKSEREVFEATETALEDLIKIIRRLTSGNASNLIVTADHGFLYQDEVEESDYTSSEPTGDSISITDRRFVMGHGLSESPGTQRYTASDLGLVGDTEVLIPKSINRFRKRGSATRFVHGGSTLQEVVVPVIQIHKGRSSDLKKVEVNLIPGTSNVISSGQLGVNLYQTGPISDKVRPRYLRVGLYAPDGILISDSHDMTFDFESDNPREREQKLRLVLSKSADNYNEQQVTLKLEEPIAGTTHFQEYQTTVYTLRRMFTSDFDF